MEEAVLMLNQNNPGIVLLLITLKSESFDEISSLESRS